MAANTRKTASAKPAKIVIEDPFEWESPDGEAIKLPRMKNLKAGVLRRVRKLGALDAMFTTMELTVDDDTLAQVDELDREQLDELSDAWVEDSKAGESSGSSD